MNTFYTSGILTVLVGLVICFYLIQRQPPEGWHLLAIFTATIVGFILRPWPTGIMALLVLLRCSH